MIDEFDAGVLVRLSFSIRTSYFVLRGSPPHSVPYCALCSSHFAVRTSRFALRGSHFAVRISRFSLRGSRSAKHPSRYGWAYTSRSTSNQQPLPCLASSLTRVFMCSSKVYVEQARITFCGLQSMKLSNRIAVISKTIKQ